MREKDPLGDGVVVPEAFDFGSLFGEEPLAAATPPPVVPQVPPAVPPQVPQPQGQVAPQEVVAQPPPGPQGAPPPPTLSPAEPQRIAEALLQNEPAILDHVAKTIFALSPEDVEALETNAVEVIPKLMARKLRQGAA